MSAATKGPRESIAAFGALRARVSDPFADRAAALVEHGLDERSFAALEAEWCARLAPNDAAARELAQAYSDAYAGARAAAGGEGGGRAAAGGSSAGERSSGAASGLTTGLPGTGGPAAGAPSTGTMEHRSAAAGTSGTAAPAAGASAAGTAAAIEPTAATNAENAAPRPIDVPSFLRERPVVFSPAPPAPAPAAPAPVPPPAVAAPPGGPGSGGLSTGTAMVDVSAILKKSVPFDPFAKPAAVPGEPGPAASAASRPGPTAPAPGTPVSGTPMSGETTDVDVAAIARRVLAFGPSGGGQAAPPAAARPAEPARQQPAFTLDQYALLSAEIALVGADPVARQIVFARFGVTDPDGLTAGWRARFAADPALAGRWSAAYAQHYARLRTERAGRR